MESETGPNFFPMFCLECTTSCKKWDTKWLETALFWSLKVQPPFPFPIIRKVITDVRERKRTRNSRGRVWHESSWHGDKWLAAWVHVRTKDEFMSCVKLSSAWLEKLKWRGNIEKLIKKSFRLLVSQNFPKILQNTKKIYLWPENFRKQTLV